MSDNLTQDNSKMVTRLHSGMWANITLQPLIMVFSIVGSVIVARKLGPELLAVVAAVSAMSATITSFMDFGLTRSLPKIMPDISVRYGKDTAIQMQYKVVWIKLLFVVIGLAAMILLTASGVWNIMEGLIYKWFYLLIAAKTILGAMLVIQQQAASAAFHHRLRAQLNLLMSVLDPAISVVLVIFWKDPYLVAAGSLLPSVAHFFILKKYAEYDFDETISPVGKISWVSIFKEYKEYISITYIIFLFNRFVYGLPLTLWILSFWGAAPVTVGNTALAVSLVQRAWDFANMPLANIRAPLLARLHILNDKHYFFEAQRLMTAMVIITSGFLAIIISSIGEPLLLLIYGSQYQDAITWGTTAATTALVVNFFSLGNSTLHQTNRFQAEIWGILGSTLFMLINTFWTIEFFTPEQAPLIVILGYVGGRCIFWVITDLWADYRIFRWKGSSIKIRSLLAISISLPLIISLKRVGENYYLFSALAGLILFFGIFRLLGGVGKQTRNSVSKILGPKFRIILYFI